MFFQKKRCIAMLLAGGQGSRLKVLTENTAKPAVPFGGKYRIIDFPLSNCVNSGIDTVGILTQYQPLELNEYIGNGQPWGLNKTHSCAQVLPPYERHDKKSGWYKGTANAIYQNIDFIDRYTPDYVVVVDETLLGTVDVASGIKPDGALIINSKKDPYEIRKMLPEYNGRICVVDAEKISMETLGKNYPNTPMLGAVVKVSKVIDEEQFIKDMEESFMNKFSNKPEVVAGNMLALKKSMEEVQEN